MAKDSNRRVLEFKGIIIDWKEYWTWW